MLHDNSSSHDSLIHLLQKQNSGTTKVKGLSLMCARAPFAGELLFLRFRSKDCRNAAEIRCWASMERDEVCHFPEYLVITCETKQVKNS